APITDATQLATIYSVDHVPFTYVSPTNSPANTSYQSSPYNSDTLNTLRYGAPSTTAVGSSIPVPYAVQESSPESIGSYHSLDNFGTDSQYLNPSSVTTQSEYIARLQNTSTTR
ncbi:hypothetical protein FRC20_002957, partial [Serendipita sp. 405]